MKNTRYLVPKGAASLLLLLFVLAAGAVDAEIVFEFIVTGNLEKLKEVPKTRLSDLDHPLPGECTPLAAAALWSKPEIVSYLLAQGADPNAVCYAAFNPLHFAVKAHQVSEKVLRMLLKAGSDPNHRDIASCTPLMMAALYQHRNDTIERILLPVTRVTDADIALLEKVAGHMQREQVGEALEILRRKIALIKRFRRRSGGRGR